MRRGLTGRYEIDTTSGETVRAFVPDPLPPQPPLELSGALLKSQESAVLALGRLDTLSSLLPDTGLFLYSYVRKEAVLSSQIEGTQSSLSDLLLFELDEAPGVPFDDVVEASNYVAALEFGLARLRGGFSLSGRLIREIHEVLLSRGRGSTRSPGEFRRSQNWIGGTRPGNAVYVPPPVQYLQDCMSALEFFLHGRDDLPIVVRAALAHVQFESIHPFLDGNGRVGRLLITLLLGDAGVLREPLLYLSLFFKENRDEYYRLLGQVREDGDWESWLEFFLIGVQQTAEGAVATARRLVELSAHDRATISARGRTAGSALRVFDVLRERPIITLSAVRDRSGLSFPAASAGMKPLTDLGIVGELTGKKRNRVFSYSAYVATLSEGT
jgi:Fic family protein